MIPKEQHRRCEQTQVGYLKSGLLPVVEEHKDGHLEGGHLQYVLPGVGACHLGSAHACV